MAHRTRSFRGERIGSPSVARVVIIATCGVLAFGWKGPLDAWQQAAGACRISGRALSGTLPLPGVSVLVRSSGAVKTATSTDPDGTYRLALADGSYDVAAELTGFTSASHAVTVGGGACDQTIDFQLTLAPRTPAAPASAAGPSGTVPSSGRRGAPPQPQQSASAQPANAAGAQRFETLTVQTQAAAAAGVETNDTSDAAARLLLPPGFSTEGPTEAVAINGNMASLDRGMMNDRLDAIGRGEFDPGDRRIRRRASGRAGAASTAARRFGGQGGRGGPGRRTGRPRRTGGPAAARRFRPRRPRPWTERLQRPDATTRSAARRSTARPTSSIRDRPRQQQPYSRQNFGVTVGGPVEIPGIYNGTAARTSTRATPATAAATSSISTRPCRPRRCAPAISRRSRTADRSGHGAAVPRQSDSRRRASIPVRSIAAAFHSAAESRRHEPQLPLRHDEPVDRRQPEPARDAQLHAERRARRAAAAAVAAAADAADLAGPAGAGADSSRAPAST